MTTETKRADRSTAGGYAHLEGPAPDEALLHAYRRFAMDDGLEVAYVDATRPGAPADAPVLLYVHGILVDHRQWFHNLDDFAATHRVLAIDLPGHGASGFRAGYPYSVRRAARAVVALLDHLGIDRATLVGNSLGGHVSMTATLDAPDRVDALVLADPAGGRFQWSDRTLLGLANHVDPLGFYGPIVAEGIVRLLLTRHRDSPVVGAYLRMMERAMACPERRALVSESLRAYLASIKRDHVIDRAHRIEVPTLLVWGRSDPIVRRRFAFQFHDRIPDSRLVLYHGVGHVPPLEVPARFRRDMSDFLSGLAGETE